MEDPRSGGWLGRLRAGGAACDQTSHPRRAARRSSSVRAGAPGAHWRGHAPSSRTCGCWAAGDVTGKALLDAAAIPYASAVATGFVGSTIAAYATEHGCDAIVMGTRGMGSAGQLLGSIARQVIQFADVPVTLVK